MGPHKPPAHRVVGSLSVPPLISRINKWLNFAGCQHTKVLFAYQKPKDNGEFRVP